MADSSFLVVVRRARAGDLNAQATIYKEYGPSIRRVIKRRLRKVGIEWTTTPHDIFDSAFTNLWTSGSVGDVDSQSHFEKYLKKVVHHKVKMLLRSLTAQKRDIRRTKVLGDEEFSLSAVPRMESEIEFDEQVTQAYELLSGAERTIAAMRRAGWSWEEIGRRFDASPNAVRMIHQRAVHKVQHRFDGR